MKQNWERNTRQYDNFWVSLLIDKILNEKEGTQRTLSRTRVVESLTMPMWVTWALSPLGSSTTHWVKLLMVESKLTGHIIWSVAVVSRTEVLQL